MRIVKVTVATPILCLNELIHVGGNMWPVPLYARCAYKWTILCMLIYLISTTIATHESQTPRATIVADCGRAPRLLRVCNEICVPEPNEEKLALVFISRRRTQWPQRIGGVPMWWALHSHQTTKNAYTILLSWIYVAALCSLQLDSIWFCLISPRCVDTVLWPQTPTEVPYDIWIFSATKLRIMTEDMARRRWTQLKRCSGWSVE